MWLPHGNVVTELYDGGNWDGAAVTSGGSTNTKGSWATIGTTSRRLDGFWLSFYFPGGAPRSMVDIGIGSSNTVIVDNLFFDAGNMNAARGAVNVFIPVRVPSGVDIKVRWQVNAGLSSVARCVIQGCAYDFAGGVSFRRAVCINAVTSTTRVSTLTALDGGSPSSTGWQEVVAAASDDYGAVILAPTYGGTHTNNATARLELGIGGSGTEIGIVQSYLVGTTTSGVAAFMPTLFPVTIRAGQRIVWRGRGPNSSVGTLSLGVMGLIR